MRKIVWLSLVLLLFAGMCHSRVAHAAVKGVGDELFAGDTIPLNVSVPRSSVSYFNVTAYCTVPIGTYDSAIYVTLYDAQDRRICDWGDVFPQLPGKSYSFGPFYGVAGSDGVPHHAILMNGSGGPQHPAKVLNFSVETLPIPDSNRGGPTSADATSINAPDRVKGALSDLSPEQYFSAPLEPGETLYLENAPTNSGIKVDLYVGADLKVTDTTNAGAVPTPFNYKNTSAEQETVTIRISATGGCTTDCTCYRLFDVRLSKSPIKPLSPDVPCAPKDSCGDGFDPENGATTAGQPGNTPSGPDPVYLATGMEDYEIAPDLDIYNPAGPDVSWARHFVSSQSLESYFSPGLSRGWVHPYDVRLESVAGSVKPLMLRFPNGSVETLTPTVDANGVVTGDFAEPAGSQYIVTGTSDPSRAGRWQTITVKWKDGTLWKFRRWTMGNFLPTFDNNGNQEPNNQLSTDTYVLDSLTNATGQSLSFVWDGARRLTSVKDNGTPQNVLLTLSYDADGLLQKATDIYGRAVWYSFAVPAASTATQPTTGGAIADKCLRTVSQIGVSTAAQPAAQQTYDYSGFYGRPLLSGVTVPSPTGVGNATMSLTYDSRARVTRILDANNNNKRYFYDLDLGGITATKVRISDAADVKVHVWYQKYDAMGRDVGTRDANDDETASIDETFVVYGDINNPYRATSAKDEEGRETTFDLDNFGNLETTTSPRNVTTTYTWDYTAWPLGRLQSVQESTVENNVTITKPATTFTYWGSGLLKTVTQSQPGGSGTTTSLFEYNALGDIQKLTLPGPGNQANNTRLITTLDYGTDGTYSQTAKKGQPLTIANNLGQVWHRRYDARGNVGSAWDPSNRQTDTTYNIADDVVETLLPATGQSGTGRGSVLAQYLYTGGPQTSSIVKNENGVTFRYVGYTYGKEGELRGVNSDTTPVTYTYDAAYRIASLTDGNNGVSTYEYDASGNLEYEKMPRAGEAGKPTIFDITRYYYDASGLVIRRTDGRGVETYFDRVNDPEGEVTDVRYPQIATDNVGFTYDAWGRVATRSDGAGKLTYGYSSADYLTSVATQYKNAVGTLMSARTIHYEYRPDGSRYKMILDGRNFIYYYDGIGRFTRLDDPQTLIYTASYNTDGLLGQQNLPGGARTEYAYNALGQMTSLINRNGAQTLLSQFGHATDATQKMTYDAAGNLLKLATNVPGEAQLTGTTNYEYGSRDRVLRELTTRGAGYDHTFGYDAGGNATTFKGAARTYNAANQRTGSGFVHDGSGNPTTYGGATLWFDQLHHMTRYYGAQTGTLDFKAGYRSDGLRAWKEDSAGVRTYFLYDGMNVVGELDGNNNFSAWQAWGPTGLVARRQILSNNAGPGALATTAIYQYDQRGNLVHRLNADGTQHRLSVSTPLSNYGHSAWGERLNEGATGLNYGRSDGPVGFGGQYGYATDVETGLILCGFRYYDPQNGRWLTRDPISYDGGVNVYAYVTSNPMGYVDPYGLSAAGKIFKEGAKFCLRRKTAHQMFNKGANLVTDGMSKKEMKRFVKKSTRKKPLYHDRDGTAKKWGPHAQPSPRPNPKIGTGYHLFSKETYTGLKTATGLLTAKHYLGDNWASEAIDFFNPLSLPADAAELGELVEHPAQATNECNTCE